MIDIDISLNFSEFRPPVVSDWAGCYAGSDWDNLLGTSRTWRCYKMHFTELQVDLNKDLQEKIIDFAILINNV
jgi:hypothetical protein